MLSKTIHVFQHVAVEGPGCIASWATDNNVQVTYTRFYESYTLPKIDSFDVLVVLGGPMSVNDIDIYPWIIEERNFIQKCIESHKAILGICLGSQFLAKAMGADVYKNDTTEIGWFPLLRHETIPASLKNIFPENPTVFHWHGDTFDIPKGAKRLYASEATPNQAFVYGDIIFALQFHFEVTLNSLEAMTKTFGDHLIESEYVQSAQEILSAKQHISDNNNRMFRLLNYLLIQ